MRSVALTVYFDSSGLVKLLIPGEAGTPVASGAFRSTDRVVTSVVAYPECRAAIAAATRGARMDTLQAHRAVEILDDIWPTVLLVAVSDGLAQAAGNLAARHRLRGFDAVHLASALTVGTDATMVCWDRDLAKAVIAEGLKVIPPLIS